MGDTSPRLMTITLDQGDTKYLFVPYYNDSEEKVTYLAYVQKKGGARHIAPAFSSWQDSDLKRWVIEKVLEYARKYNVTTWIDDVGVYVK